MIWWLATSATVVAYERPRRLQSLTNEVSSKPIAVVGSGGAGQRPAAPDRRS